jgi:hypothetical protein
MGRKVIHISPVPKEEYSKEAFNYKIMKVGLRNLNVGGTGPATGASGVQVNDKRNCFDAVHPVAQCERDCDVIIDEDDQIFVSQLILESTQRHANVVNLSNI